jgi:hypothetical protein
MKKLLALFLMAVICVCALVACGNSGMESAVSNLQQLQKEVKEATPADYEVVGKLTINGDTFTVAWTVNVTEGVKIVVADDGTVTVDVNEYTETEIPYVLTATITAPNGETSTLSFNYKVPAFKELTWAEYMAKADDEAVVIKGVVTAIFNGENEKVIYVDEKTDFDIKFIGTGTGLMTYSLGQCDLAQKKVQEPKTFRNIMLNEGKTIFSPISKALNTDDTELFVVEEKGGEMTFTHTIETGGVETIIDNTQGDKPQDDNQQSNDADPKAGWAGCFGTANLSASTSLLALSACFFFRKKKRN